MNVPSTMPSGDYVEYYDMPAVRSILREAEADDYHWSTLILAIVKSAPFQIYPSHGPSSWPHALPPSFSQASTSPSGAVSASVFS